MSSQCEYYDYYIVQGDDVANLIKAYDALREQRNAVLKQAIEKVGAIAWTTSSGWGDKGDKLADFVWPADHGFACPITIKSKTLFDGKPVIVARGKGNTKEGRAFNKELDTIKADVNSKLSSLPCWQSYIINHYGVMRTGIGGRAGQGFGFAMLSTYGGKHPTRDDTLLFAIPNNKEERHGDVTIPDSFQKITYGVFYDITNTKSETAA